MKIEPSKVEAYAFILDNNRYNENIDIDNPMLFNNQYEITEEEMPDIDVLNKLNISKASYCYNKSVKEDILGYLKYLEKDNFNVDMIDLGEQL